MRGDVGSDWAEAGPSFSTPPLPPPPPMAPPLLDRSLPEGDCRNGLRLAENPKPPASMEPLPGGLVEEAEAEALLLSRPRSTSDPEACGMSPICWLMPLLARAGRGETDGASETDDVGAGDAADVG